MIVNCQTNHGRGSNCDVPDLDLFPQEFATRTVLFQAGVELNVVNYTLSALAALRRILPVPNLPCAAPLFLRGSMLLYHFGTRNGSLAVWVRGTSDGGEPIERRLAIVTDDDGPATPCSASIILARRILDHGPPCVGAFPCIGFVTLAELEAHLRRFGVWLAQGSDDQAWERR